MTKKKLKKSPKITKTETDRDFFAGKRFYSLKKNNLAFLYLDNLYTYEKT